jgi:hypothetical protein
LSSAEPRPALTVIGGKVAGAGWAGGGVSCALASAGVSARPAKAAKVAARADSMKNSPERQTNATHG